MCAACLWSFTEDKSCENFVNIGVHFVQLQVEDVEGDGGLDVQEGEDVSNKIVVSILMYGLLNAVKETLGITCQVEDRVMLGWMLEIIIYTRRFLQELELHPQR